MSCNKDCLNCELPQCIHDKGTRSPGNDPDSSDRQDKQRYYQKHKERINARAKQRYQEKRKEILEYQRQYRKTHKMREGL